MAISKPCTHCGSTEHTGFYCYKKPRTPIKARSKPAGGVVKQKANNLTSKANKPQKRALTKKLEVLVKLYVKLRDDYTCQRCGKKLEGVNCHASHVIPVSRSGYLRCEPMNMKVLCYHDHMNWWHKHPIEAGAWFTDTFPERWEYLKAIHIQRLKPPREDELIEKISYYKTEVARIKSEKGLV